MSNAASGIALLRGEIDVDQYWHESGEQQAKSAGVFLAEQQRDRVLRNLTRLAVTLRQVDFCLPTPKGQLVDRAQVHDVASVQWQQAFEQYLATYR